SDDALEACSGMSCSANSKEAGLPRLTFCSAVNKELQRAVAQGWLKLVQQFWGYAERGRSNESNIPELRKLNAGLARWMSMELQAALQSCSDVGLTLSGWTARRNAALD